MTVMPTLPTSQWGRCVDQPLVGRCSRCQVSESTIRGVYVPCNDTNPHATHTAEKAALCAGTFQVR